MRGNLLLLLTAFIWGVAFLAQKEGGQMGDLTFNGVRSFLAGGMLCLLLPLLDKMGLSHKPATKAEKKALWLGGVLCGVALFAATNLQQLGVSGTSTGKAGMITSLYIVLVPIFGLFIGRRTTLFSWLGVVLALVGLYFLSGGIGTGDLLVMGCAPMLAIQILLVDHFAPKTDGVRLSCIQFFTVGLLNLPLMFWLETPSWGAMLEHWVSVLYAGLLSSGVAYTLQIIAQKDTHPTTASLLMSFESVFAVLAGVACVLITGNGKLPEAQEWIGCGILFAAVIVAQLPTPTKKGA